jgi:uncharacterized protein YbjT (DUF2867 family)
VASISRQDCANAAAGALTAPDIYEGAVLDITGSRAFSYANIVRSWRRSKGTRILIRSCRPEEYKAVLANGGLPWRYAELFVSFDQALRQGQLEQASDSVLFLMQVRVAAWFRGQAWFRGHHT